MYRRRVLAVMLFLTVVGCRHHPFRSTGEPVAGVTRTLVTPKGKIKVTRVCDREYGDHDAIEVPTTAFGATGDTYQGTARRDVKTSVCHGAGERTFATLGELLEWLPDDNERMWNHQPPISNAADSTRVSEEEWLVTVGAFLYAAKHEPDNDYHLILGQAPGDPAKFMTVEISGLPKSGHPDRAALKLAREEFKSFLGDGTPQGSSYDRYDEPIPVRVTGCLFFDTSHHAGLPNSPGPAEMKPGTTWELHPVTEIVFEP
jgi:hypothetical protein